LIWVLVRGASVVPHVASIGRWDGFCEALALMIGSWILWASLVRAGVPPHIKLLDDGRAMRVARILFGASAVVFGLSHFAYADFTARMIPRCFPARLWLAYLTGACHLAAGLGILTSIFARLAATLEALMLGSFVLLVHVPSTRMAPPPEWAPSAQGQWTELFLAWVLAASAGIVATSLGDGPWGTSARRGIARAGRTSAKEPFHVNKPSTQQRRSHGPFVDHTSGGAQAALAVRAASTS
jgi:uncharacterized membrane protein